MSMHGLPLLTAAAMRAADAHTINTLGVPGQVLMETAGQQATRHIVQNYGPLSGMRVVIACGSGNNGGDGLVVARELLDREAHVHLLTSIPLSEYEGDAGANAQILQRLASTYADHLHHTVVTTPDACPPLTTLRPQVCVDALLGTGLSDAPREPLATVIRRLNQTEAPTVALDIPSGLHGDTGQSHDPTVRAHSTVAFGAEKVGGRLAEGPAHAGQIQTVRIGIPQHVLHDAATNPGCAHATTDALVQAARPQRDHTAHKYNVGMVLVIGGSAPYPGAPILAARAAARSGAGYVACAVPASIQGQVATHSPAFPVHGLPETGSVLEPGSALNVLQPLLEKARAVLLGPGLSTDAATQTLVRRVATAFNGPIVWDAGALPALTDHLDLCRKQSSSRWILTPHAGEFRRLTATNSLDWNRRISLAQQYAADWNATLLLKGHPSVVADPTGNTYVGRTGGPALAVAGTGDVLAGLCAGLAAQGTPPLDAAAAALHWGGRAADRYADTHDARTLSPLDLIDLLPTVV